MRILDYILHRASHTHTNFFSLNCSSLTKARSSPVSPLRLSPCQVSSDTHCIKAAIWNPCKSSWPPTSPPPARTAATELRLRTPTSRSATTAFQNIAALSLFSKRTKRRSELHNGLKLIQAWPRFSSNGAKEQTSVTSITLPMLYTAYYGMVSPQPETGEGRATAESLPSSSSAQ